MPTLYTKQDLVAYCLRSLGEPVIEVNVSDEQLEDRVDDALKLFFEKHEQGSIRHFIDYTITQQDIDRKYIILNDETIWTVIRIFPFNTSALSINNLQYQAYLQDIVGNFFNGSLGVGEFLRYEGYLNGLNFLFNHEKRIRWNKHTRQLHIDTEWDKVKVGMKIGIECFKIISDEDYADVYNNTWLQRYTRELIKRQWGDNLTKFSGFVLPSGQTLDGQRILDEANEKITQLEEELKDTWSQTGAIMLVG